MGNINGIKGNQNVVLEGTKNLIIGSGNAVMSGD